MINVSRKVIDLTGQVFGRLTVIKRAENRGKIVYWLCRCECGNEVEVRGNHLKDGKIKSCGCWRKERMSKMASEQTGQKNPNYNHDLTVEERANSRKNCEHDQWSKEVKKQADYTCDICGKKGRKTTRSPLK